MSRTPSRPARSLLLPPSGRNIAPMLVLLAGAAPAAAQVNPVFLQWYENRWPEMERRTPDFFMAGYGALWLPPVSKCASDNSVGYDVFDRFDLGRPGAPTAYGTEQDFRAVVGELQAANGLVHIDIVLNHNSFRQTSAGFQAAGGYPGFWMAPANPPTDKQPTSNWGDFHAGNASGYLQSTDPNAPNYNLHNGDLVALIDIAQESNHQFIRHPVQPGHPQNIPAGAVYNQPDPDNHRFYPDQQLQPFTFINPGTSRNPGPEQFTFYPFNTAAPLQGDPVTDNTTGLLMRWSQWMLDEFKVDGFRIDAIKHTPSWFFDRYWDSAVYLRRTAPWGAKVTPFSFGESVEGNSYTYNNYVRKDAFASRDALDLNGAGQLRDINNASGFGSWQNVLSAHLDNADDGFNNGTLGVMHVFSHDNGSTGNGGSPPPDPTRRQQALPSHAYMLTRPGPAIVYYNARGINRSGGFWPRQGTPIALGFNPSGQADPALTDLVRINNQYARGEFNPLNNTDPQNQSIGDVLVFERRRNQGGGNFSANLLAAVNDRYDSGYQVRNVQTSFPPGTRLHELTGASASPVSPAGQVPPVLVVDANRRVTITIPNNVSSAGEHARGYVVYGPAVPSGQLTVTNIASTIPADPAAAPHWYRRNTAVPVISAPVFSIVLTTTKTDPQDPNWDDNALFRIDRGFVDYNANGIVDRPHTDPVAPGYESFLTLNQPLYGTANSTGQYAQTIDSSLLSEGFHYITALAFRHREANTDPLFGEFRQVIYIDREPPAVELLDASQPIPTSTYIARVRPLDRTTTRVHYFVDLPAGSNPIALANPLNQGVRHDRFEWRKTFIDLNPGPHTLTVVAFEESGNASVNTYNLFVGSCYPNCDGSAAAPILNVADFGCFLQKFAAGDAYANCDGSTTAPALNVADFGCFLQKFAAGCP